jgi:hypothetical protein
LSYVSRKAAGISGTNLTTKAEISNLPRSKFPGQVTHVRSCERLWVKLPGPTLSRRQAARNVAARSIRTAFSQTVDKKVKATHPNSGLGPSNVISLAGSGDDL